MKKLNLKELGIANDIISHEEKKRILGGRLDTDEDKKNDCMIFTYVDCMDDCAYAGGTWGQCDTYCYYKALEWCL